MFKKKCMYGDDSRYAASRVADTIVLHKNKPVMIRAVRDMVAQVNDPLVGDDERDGKIYEIPMGELEFLNFKLGFLNTNHGCIYLHRSAKRHDWRQGLRPNNVKAGVRRASYRQIAKVLIQKYPDFDGAVHKAQVTGMSAWCKELAIDANGAIVWRFDHVGNYADGVITLGERYKFLKEFIEESANGRCKIV